MLEWLIVGGGVHGTHLSHVLVNGCGVARDRLRVLDPWEAPLARWEECTVNVGMRALRSTYVHHLDLLPFSLRQFARRGGRRRRETLVGEHRRPLLELFRAHCAEVVESGRLAELRLPGRAEGVRPVAGGWAVETAAGALEARRVVLAMGAGEQCAIPPWAAEARSAGAAVHHVFEPGFRREALPPWRHAVVVGGGISAVQAALALAGRAPGTVTLLARHSMRIRHFDAEPGWLGARYLGRFHAEPSPERRRGMIAGARHRGSVPPDVASAFRAALVRKAVALASGEVAAAAVEGDGTAALALAGGGEVRADLVLLATGFAPGRPGGAWLDRGVEALGLRCAACGFPVVDRALRWHPGLFVTGPLAELELGPAARNIVGARMAAERLRQAA
jgi:cation diffusion facilitator CzcD-associated flavoprotein CzcO